MIWVLSIGYAMAGPGIETDEVYAEVRKEFGEEEVVNLSLAIMTNQLLESTCDRFPQDPR